MFQALVYLAGTKFSYVMTTYLAISTELALPV